jgi:hypothetical protein
MEGAPKMTKATLMDDKDIRRFNAKVEKSDNPEDCWIWQGAKNVQGYGVFYHDKRQVGAHRFSYALANNDASAVQRITGNRAFGKVYVLHSCDNPACVNPDHLRLGSANDNAADMKARNRTNSVYGLQNVSGKTSDAAVREIRKKAGSWNGMCKMMMRHKIGQSQIMAIHSKKQRATVTD